MMYVFYYFTSSYTVFILYIHYFICLIVCRSFTRYRGTIEWLGEFEPYMPDRCARQFGRVQGLPTPLTPPLPTFQRTSSLKKIKVVEYTPEFDRWADKEQHLRDITGLPCAMQGWEVQQGYLEWYGSMTHMYIL